MALNPTLRRLIADAQAKYADRPTCDADDDRESLSNFIGNTLERIHATPGTELVDYQQEAKTCWNRWKLGLLRVIRTAV
ncbi:hypothetical protein HED52_12535 [Ochrobactrum ciceri]|uniref:Uncharacterized protein n=1 Tax=Brucella ciceri TaxID=391287 RepID=A0ABX1DXI5_9HYPH|nr:hypothetical protein [Brucella ciceri]NKC28507.1 hypothetical protein [Brucella ciceri]